MRFGRLSSIAAIMTSLGGIVAPAHAQEPAAAPSAEPSLSHRHQFGLSLMPGVGYRIIVPYRDNVDCGDSSGSPKSVCTARSPVFLDVAASYGLSPRIDLLFDVRLGLEGERYTSSHQLALAPGLRIWLDEDGPLKFYTTIQGVYDSTAQNTNGVSDTDVGFRNANGVMYDLMRNFGFFAQFGETFGFKRWFRIEVDAGLGAQVRFP